MGISIWDGFTADWTHLFGQDWNVTPSDMETYGAEIARAAGAAARIRERGCGPREGERVLFPHLPYLLQEKTLMPEEEIAAMESLSAECCGGFDVVLSVGIGGSYLGNQALFDACCGPYWNLMTREARGGRNRGPGGAGVAAPLSADTGGGEKRNVPGADAGHFQVGHHRRTVGRAVRAGAGAAPLLR